MSAPTDIPMFLWKYGLPYKVTIVTGTTASDLGTGKYGSYDRWQGVQRHVMKPRLNPGKWETNIRELYLFYRERMGAYKPFLFPMGNYLEQVGNNEFQVGHGGMRQVVAAGDGITDTFLLPDKYVDPSSVEIYVDGVAQQSAELLVGTAKTMDNIDNGGAWNTHVGYGGEPSVTSEFLSPEPGVVKSGYIDGRNQGLTTADSDLSGVTYNYSHSLAGTQTWQGLVSHFHPSQYVGDPGGDFLFGFWLNAGVGSSDLVLPASTHSHLNDFWVVHPHSSVSSGPGNVQIILWNGRGYALGGPKKVSYVARPSLRSTNWLFVDGKLNNQTDGTEIVFQAGHLPVSGAVIEAAYTRLKKVRFMPGSATFDIGAGHLADPGTITLLEEME